MRLRLILTLFAALLFTACVENIGKMTVTKTINCDDVHTVVLRGKSKLYLQANQFWLTDSAGVRSASCYRASPEILDSTDVTVADGVLTIDVHKVDLPLDLKHHYFPVAVVKAPRLRRLVLDGSTQVELLDSLCLDTLTIENRGKETVYITQLNSRIRNINIGTVGGQIRLLQPDYKGKYSYQDTSFRVNIRTIKLSDPVLVRSSLPADSLAR